MNLKGFHHLTAVTADAPGNHKFYTNTLGLRLVKKTVNQDDTSAYHLFYADGVGSPGTDITFFDWPAGPESRGTQSVTRTGFRVASEEALKYWQDRLAMNGVRQDRITQVAGRPTLPFEDHEGQRLCFTVDAEGEAHVWDKSPVPPEHQIRGLGPITMSVPDIRHTDMVLTRLMNMTPTGSFSGTHVYKMGAPGAVGELHVTVDPTLPPARQGAGSVHHVAFNIPYADYEAWADRLSSMKMPNSGPVDRFWFKSLYFREPSGVLFELATDAPGFATDEPMDKLGATLSLPPFLEGRRGQIEAGLKKL
ncbi:ring-cleaving dioxygenase [Aestuariivirga sp.]|uniref:ring-cleaving dioxygenase n=1 Tax=Aestuariivirga sp. TaxID=2650926 RepID=UPI0025BF914B|nr:ring-cleaving dioxygenase [Aestuariivirga sp.]MCA3555849.1 ring-cleaving dioxygenase [Aestuariivirga sp.]